MNHLGAFYSNNFRNILFDYGYTEKKIDKKVQQAWEDLFGHQSPDKKIYFDVEPDMGYMLDTGNNDVRTEGMSYGMMMAVQMNKKDVFDRLWKWTKTYMYMEYGDNAGYFAWSCTPDGEKNAYGPAPDGEEYFALALFFASHRWGDEAFPFNYSEQAKDLLHVCIHKGEHNDGYPMWNRENKLIKFIPNVEFSDPSYHLPHFYELFALWANEIDRPFWKEAANASRNYIAKSAHPVTGLTPEYAYYNGSPNYIRGFGHFFSDSYRVSCNIALDYEWFRDNACPTVVNEKIQAFFVNKEPNDYRRYKIDGTPFEEKSLHPIGLIAANAMASLSTQGDNAKKCVDLFWTTPLRTGERRYYDNCLYFFSLLALSGNFKIYKPMKA